jgi:hypothetical protein
LRPLKTTTTGLRVMVTWEADWIVVIRTGAGPRFRFAHHPIKALPAFASRRAIRFTFCWVCLSCLFPTAFCVGHGTLEQFTKRKPFA